MRVRHVEWVGTGQRIADACRLRHSLPESTATYQDCRVRCNCPPRPGHENNSRHRTAEAPPEVLRRKVSRGHVLGTNRRVSAGVLNNLRGRPCFGENTAAPHVAPTHSLEVAGHASPASHVA
jgi:hypothetical protein